MKPNPLSPGLQLSLTKENQNQKYEYLTPDLLMRHQTRPPRRATLSTSDVQVVFVYVVHVPKIRMIVC